MINFNIRKPLFTISITIDPTTGEVTRSQAGFFPAPTTTRTLPLEGLVEGMKKWSEGEVIQDAFPNLDLDTREWLIAG